MDRQDNVGNVPNLIDMFPPNENISLINDIAIEQQVSFTFERILHKYMYNDSKESFVLGAYICLIKVDPALYGDYCKHLLNFVSEETLNKALLHIKTGVIPYDIFVDKLLSDLNEDSYLYEKSSVGSMLAVFLLKTMRASLTAYNKAHKALMEDYHRYSDSIKRAIDMAYSWYLEYPVTLKEEYAKAFYAEYEDVQVAEKERIRFLDNELTIFSEVLADMVQLPLNMELIKAKEEGEIPQFAPVWLHRQGAGVTASSKYVELMGGADNVAVVYIHGNEGEEEIVMSDNGDGTVSEVSYKHEGTMSGMGSFAENVLGYSPMGDTPEQVAKMGKKKKEVMQNAIGAFRDNKLLSLIQTQIENFDIEEEDDVEEKPQPKVERTTPVPPMNARKVQYVVKKIAKNGSSRCVSTRWFNTKEEAEQFKAEIEKTQPEMIKNFEFRVEQGYRE